MTMEEKKVVIAESKYNKVGADKVRRICNIVRDKTVDEALIMLKNLPHSAARLVNNVILSAKANAVNNSKLEEDTLVISKLIVNEGPATKRFRSRAKGRIFPIKKRSSHILVEIEEGDL